VKRIESLTRLQSQFRDQGNKAFKAGDFEGAIANYSEAITLDKSSHVNYANRSAAFLKVGEYQNALDDANACIALKRDYYKGYGRKGSAYHAMEKYSHAVAAFKEGLKICKDEPILQKGLAAAKKARMETTDAARAVRKTEATQRASLKRTSRAQTATTVSSFVMQTRKELEMQMVAIQAQLDLINELAAMTDEEKLDLLFSLIDRDGDGTIDAKELAAALRKRNENLSFVDSLERAIDMVNVFDRDGDAKLDYDEFGDFVQVMIKELQTEFNEFAEFLVLQILFKDAAVDKDITESSGEAELSDMLNDPRMMELFRIFDHDGSRQLQFVSVAKGLYSIALHMDEYVQRTMSSLLMMEPNDQRTLNYEQFSKFIMAIVASADTTFEDISDDLIIALTRNNGPVDMTDLLVTAAMTQAAQDLEDDRCDGEDTISALSYGRLQKLFDLWDIDGDGDMTMDELQLGLETFQKAAGTNADFKSEAAALLGFDEDGDDRLGRKEFARAMVFYAKTYKVELHELIDFMCVATSLGENTAVFQEAYGKALVVGAIPQLKPANLEWVEEEFSDDEDLFSAATGSMH